MRPLGKGRLRTGALIFFPPLCRASTRTDCRILSMPLGPRVVLTRSAMAMAPMKECMRAFSPCKARSRGAGRVGEGKDQQRDRGVRGGVACGVCGCT